MIHIRCDHCTEEFAVGDDKAGVFVSCPSCRNEILPATARNATRVAEPVGVATGDAGPPPIGNLPAKDDPPPPQPPPAAARVDDVPERNLTPEHEDDKRRRGLFCVGLAMTLGFLAPVVGPGGVLAFPELNAETGVFRGEAIGLADVARVLPLAVGVLVMVLARAAEAPLRGVAVLLAGGSLFALFFADATAREAITSSFRTMPGTVTLSFVLAAGGVVGLFAGARARWYRPESKLAWLAGALAAASYGTYLGMPSGGDPPVIAAVKMVEMHAFSGIVLLSNYLLTAAAGLACLCNPPWAARERAVARAGRSFGLLVAGLLVPVVAAVVSVFLLPGEFLTAIVSSAVKYGVMYGGLLLLVPVGLTDALAGSPWRSDSFGGTRLD